MPRSGRLFGVKAVVFGAASGIGEAIARIFAKHDATVLAVDGPDTGIERQLSSVSGVTGRALSLKDVDGAATAIQTAVRDFGGLDVIVNSFSLQPGEPFKDEAALREALSRRLDRLRHHFDLALPHLKKSPSGRIVTIGHVRSAFPRDAVKLVAIAENALAELTRELAAKTGRDGITVNYIQPGAVMTSESRRVFATDRAFRDECIRRSAARRLGDPIDIAKVALFLASDDAAFVSGTGLRVDGGRAD